MRTALGLRSTWVTIGVLRLDHPGRDAVVFGSSARLSGIGRGLGAARLSSSPDGAMWTPGATLSPDPAGVVSVDVKPQRTTRYRLEAQGGASPALLVQVAPRLTLTRPTPTEPGVLAGTIRPKLTGSAVAIERKKGANWVLVGEATVAASGGFRLELDAALPAGSYRARSTAQHRARRRQLTGHPGDRMRGGRRSRDSS